MNNYINKVADKAVKGRKRRPRIGMPGGSQQPQMSIPENSMRGTPNYFKMAIDHIRGRNSRRM